MDVYIEYIDSILEVGSIENTDLLKDLIGGKQAIIQKWLQYHQVCKNLNDNDLDENSEEWPKWPFKTDELRLFSEDDCWGEPDSWYLIPLEGVMYYTTPKEFTEDEVVIPSKFGLEKFKKKP